MSRERLKLLFKQHCEPHNGTIVLKVTTIQHSILVTPFTCQHLSNICLRHSDELHHELIHS